jgi:hypothetical protein
MTQSFAWCSRDAKRSTSRILLAAQTLLTSRVALSPVARRRFPRTSTIHASTFHTWTSLGQAHKSSRTLAARCAAFLGQADVQRKL